MADELIVDPEARCSSPTLPTAGPPADTFGGASGEEKARAFEVYGYEFLARNPG